VLTLRKLAAVCGVGVAMWLAGAAVIVGIVRCVGG
jgi:hypothetical protein